MAEETKQPASEYRFQGLVRVELADPRNRQVLFPPTGMRLRGRFDRANLVSDERVDSMEGLPVLPGLYLEVEVKGNVKTCRILDPLGFEENKEVLRQAQESVKQFRGEKPNPQEDYEETNVNDDTVKTWLYWIRRMLDRKATRNERGNPLSGPLVSMVQGSMAVPTLEKIMAMPGRIRIGQFSSGPKRTYKGEDDAA